jgi:sialate O-acetylesterase
MKFKIALIALFIFQITISKAQTKVSPLFSDDMVLQQNSNVAIWGEDKPNTKITVKASWNTENSVQTDANGKWKVFVKTTTAGGPYTLEIKGSETLNFKDVLLGEVWLASGQSNMEMPMKGFRGQPIEGSNELILKGENPNLRLITIKKSIKTEPTTDFEGTWKKATPETVKNFSAVAYMFAKKIQENTNVPVGIICSSFGGTRVEAWMDEQVLAEKNKELNAVDKQKEKDLNKNTASVLYNGMIHPIIPYGIKGAIWYQGESNRGNAEHYASLFSTMIDSWRKEWNLGDFPFYFTQIAPFEYKNKAESAYLREAQLQTMLTTKNTGMAVTLDIGEEFYIHPRKKAEVAERLALWALANTYNFKGINFSGPVYKSMKVEKDIVFLDFDYAKNGVANYGKELVNFTIAGEDKIFYPAKATITKGVLTVSSENVPNPVAVRYGWENFLVGNLYNTAGLPASSFRTDHWKD